MFSSQFVDHAHAGFRMAEGRLGEVCQQGGDGLVVGRACHAVDADGQRVFLLVRFDVGGRDEEFADQGAGLVLLGKTGTQHTGIGDREREFVGIDGDRNAGDRERECVGEKSLGTVKE